MIIDDIQKALTGQKLLDSFAETHAKREIIADGFLYGHTINMIAAEPGAGKSTISTQVAVELTAGIPVFGLYEVPKPFKVLYIQTERSILELLERLEIISKVYPIIAENLFVTDEYQRLNLLIPKHVEMLIKCIHRDCGKPDVIFIDPIYAMVSGGLKDDIPASAFTKGMSRLQKETGAVLWYNHHTVKVQYSPSGHKIDREDPFYGSQWIKAHVTSSYHLREISGGVKLTLKKDNYNIMPKDISLDFDPETGLCSIPIEEIPSIDRIRGFLNLRKKDGKSFTFKDICQVSQTSSKTAQRALTKLGDSIGTLTATMDKHKKVYKFNNYADNG